MLLLFDSRFIAALFSDLGFMLLSVPGDLPLPWIVAPRAALLSGNGEPPRRLYLSWLCLFRCAKAPRVLQVFLF
jgi:hypothetical protein